MCYGVLFLYFEPFVEEIIVNFSLYSDCFVAFFRRSIPLYG